MRSPASTCLRLVLAASATAAAVAAASPMLAAEVRYFPAAEVSAAFDEGAVLYDGAGGANYMVHASRRDTAGQVEVHAKDSDVIYVLGGATTFVTGGTVIDGKPTAPDEIRGRTIDG